MTPTPRSDGRAVFVDMHCTLREAVPADFARELERENAALRKCLGDMLENYIVLKRISLIVAGRDGRWGGEHLTPEDDRHVMEARAMLAKPAR